MTTTWVSMTRFEPRSWLLANGEVVNEPPLEQTSTGRKVRVANTTETFYSKDLDDLLRVAVEKIAKDKGTSVFLPLHGMAAAERNVVPDVGPATLHLNTQETLGSTTCWWKFRHPSMPYSLTFVATLTQDRSYRQHLVTWAAQPRAFGHYNHTTEGAFDKVATTGAALYGLPNATPWQENVRDNPLEWTAETLDATDRQFGSSRLGAEGLLKIVRKMEDLDTLKWFDFRGKPDADYLELELYDTNVNNQFVSDLTDYLDGNPTVEKAAELYEQLLDTLRSCGLVVEKTDGNDFLRAMNSNTLRMTVKRLAEEDDGQDMQHAVVINMSTGTMLVECSARSINNNEIAEHWEEAKTVAALTGEEDELLAYARAYIEKNASRRTKRILKERGA